jgi:hypothetical protein
MATARTRGSAAPSAKPRSDVYTGLLILSLVFLTVGMLFLWLDYREYPDSKPPAVPDRSRQVQAGAPGGAPPVTRPPAGPGAPPAPPPGGAPPAPPGKAP